MFFNCNFLKLAGVAAVLFSASPASCASPWETTPDAASQASTPVSPVSAVNPSGNDETGGISSPGEISDPIAHASLTPLPSDDTSNLNESVDYDPRNGVCTVDELTDLNTYFSATPNPCVAYTCIDTEMIMYKDLIMAHYPDFGSEEAIEDLAGVFAGCHCRCPVMKCEVDYIKEHGSAACYESTLKYCAASNTGFTERCTKAAENLPKVYDLVLDAKSFSKPCQVCTPETGILQEQVVGDPLAIALTPSVVDDAGNQNITGFASQITDNQNPTGVASQIAGDLPVESSDGHSHMDINYLSILTASYILSIALYW